MMRPSGSQLSRTARLGACALASLLITGCNAIFDLSAGMPRRLCADPMLIDDMEDGDDTICATSERVGKWFVFGDGTTSAELNPSSSVPFEPTLIEEGARGSSRYAARLRGSGFSAWGAVLALDLAPGQGYDASGLGGVQFWMRSITPISFVVGIQETIPISNGGECADSAGEQNCYNNFTFPITAPSRDWVRYQVPFNALRQAAGSTTWTPRHLKTIQFNAPSGAEFDVSVDDLSFYRCAGPECQPTCTDPELPVPCRQGDGTRSSCQPPKTDCATAGKILDPILVATGGGDAACVGLPGDQAPRCFLDASTGIPFAVAIRPLTDGLSNSRLFNPEPGKVCIHGTMTGNGAAAISLNVTPFTSEGFPVAIDPFDLQALDITALEYTITHPPLGGVSLQLSSLVKPECSVDFDCLGPVYSLSGSSARVFETKTVRTEMTEFEPADPEPTLVWAFNFWANSSSRLDANYDFCVEDVKFIDSFGELVTP